MEMAALKEIVAIKSADGCYFVIGKNEQGFFLKNKYTKIPNEFHLYNDEEVKELFQDLCDRVEECVPVSYCNWTAYDGKRFTSFPEVVMWKAHDSNSFSIILLKKPTFLRFGSNP